MGFWKKEPEKKINIEKEIDLHVGTRVPTTGEYKCNFCMLGGMTDLAFKALLKEGLLGKNLPKTLGARDLRNVMLLRGWVPDVTNILQAQDETVRAFVEGETFTECPTCRGKTGWTLMKYIPELLRGYERA